MKRIVVAFTGLMSVGKTTAALYLCEKYDYRRVRFAGPLKDMAAAFGLSPNHIEGHLKEQPCALLGGKSPRYFMQMLGTEFGRNMIDPDLWIRAWQHSVKQVPEGVPIVADDCRFPNEAAAVYRAGSVCRVCRITRGSTEAAPTHVSELQVFKADKVIENNWTVEDLYEQLDTLVRRINRAAKIA